MDQSEGIQLPEAILNYRKRYGLPAWKNTCPPDWLKHLGKNPRDEVLLVTWTDGYFAKARIITSKKAYRGFINSKKAFSRQNIQYSLTTYGAAKEEGLIEEKK